MTSRTQNTNNQNTNNRRYVMSTYSATVRSHSSRSLVMWVAMGAALIGTVLVIALVSDDNGPSRSAPPSAVGRPIGPHARSDGGPNEGTRGARTPAQAESPVVRFDGGPNEGSRGIVFESTLPTAPTFDRGPRAGRVGEPVSHTPTLSPTVSPTRFDGGPEEGTRGAR